MKLVQSVGIKKSVEKVVIERMNIIPKPHARLQEVLPIFSDTLRYDTV